MDKIKICRSDWMTVCGAKFKEHDFPTFSLLCQTKVPPEIVFLDVLFFHNKLSGGMLCCHWREELGKASVLGYHPCVCRNILSWSSDFHLQIATCTASERHQRDRFACVLSPKPPESQPFPCLCLSTFLLSWFCLCIFHQLCSTTQWFSFPYCVFLSLSVLSTLSHFLCYSVLSCYFFLSSPT